MKPSQLARSLRRIAAKIENSKAPRRDLVAADLKRVIAAMETPSGATSGGVENMILTSGHTFDIDPWKISFNATGLVATAIYEDGPGDFFEVTSTFKLTAKPIIRRRLEQYGSDNPPPALKKNYLLP